MQNFAKFANFADPKAVPGVGEPAGHRDPALPRERGGLAGGRGGPLRRVGGGRGVRGLWQDVRTVRGLGLAKLGTFAKFCKFLAGSFSAVSKRNFARKYAFDSIFQALQDLHTFAPLQSQNFSKKSV